MDIVIFLALLSAVIIPALMVIMPIYNVWASKKRGEAELAEANYAEQVAIAQAKARKSAATLNKESEIIEAQAVEISIKTIGSMLQKNPSYNVWQWIKMMDKDNNKSVIYVPTESNLPILEAMRLKQDNKPEEDESNK